MLCKVYPEHYIPPLTQPTKNSPDLNEELFIFSWAGRSLLMRGWLMLVRGLQVYMSLLSVQSDGLVCLSDLMVVWSGLLTWSDGLVSCSGLIWWPGLAVCSDQLIWCCVVWWSVWGKWRRLFEATTKLKWKRNLITKWQQKLLNSEVTMLKQTDRIREVKMVFFSLFFLKSSIRLNISAWVHQITVSLIHLVQQHSVKKRTECYTQC